MIPAKRTYTTKERISLSVAFLVKNFQVVDTQPTYVMGKIKVKGKKTKQLIRLESFTGGGTDEQKTHFNNAWCRFVSLVKRCSKTKEGKIFLLKAIKDLKNLDYKYANWIANLIEKIIKKDDFSKKPFATI